LGSLFFEDVEELDFVGPMEVFGAASLIGASCLLQVVAQTVEPVRCRWGMRVIPDLSIGCAGAQDIVIIPGGPGARTQAFKNEEILRYVSLPHRFLMSVCTGSVILAATQEHAR
jgi:putative intracellular protease/amidase